MAVDEIVEDLDSGASYPRTESTIITPDKLINQIDNILHNAGIVGIDDDDLYPTPQEMRIAKINQILEDCVTEEGEIFKESEIEKEKIFEEINTELINKVDEKFTEIEASGIKEFSQKDFKEIKNDSLKYNEKEALESI
jgi:hypothetical protein